MSYRYYKSNHNNMLIIIDYNNNKWKLGNEPGSLLWDHWRSMDETHEACLKKLYYELTKEEAFLELL